LAWQLQFSTCPAIEGNAQNAQLDNNKAIPGEQMFWSRLRAFRRNDEVIVNTDGRTAHLPEHGEVKISIQVNCTNATCPRPQILAIKAHHRLAAGEVMEIISGNASAAESLRSLSYVLYLKHLGTLHEEGVWRIFMEREANAQPMRDNG
jgi:TusA-related sulfurtransferase